MDEVKTVHNESNLEQIFLDNRGLVHMAARRFMGRGVEYDDLVQLSSLGLLKAARKFQPELGYAFSTYAVPMMLGEIRRFLRDDGPLHISRTLKENGQRLRKLEADYLLEHGDSPTISILSEMSGLSQEEVVEALDASTMPVSLETPTLEGEGRLMDIISTGGIEDRSNLRLDIRAGIESLSRLEQQIVSLRYYHGLTQVETGRLLSLSQVQISRGEKKILTKLRQKLMGTI